MTLGREWLAPTRGASVAIESANYADIPRPPTLPASVECGHSHPADLQQAVDGTWWCLGCGGKL